MDKDAEMLSLVAADSSHETLLWLWLKLLFFPKRCP
jgi:hypothetical protein